MENRKVIWLKDELGFDKGTLFEVVSESGAVVPIKDAQGLSIYNGGCQPVSAQWLITNGFAEWVEEEKVKLGSQMLDDYYDNGNPEDIEDCPHCENGCKSCDGRHLPEADKKAINDSIQKEIDTQPKALGDTVNRYKGDSTKLSDAITQDEVNDCVEILTTGKGDKMHEVNSVNREVTKQEKKDRRNLYKILGIKKNATLEQIGAGYRAMAIVSYPEEGESQEALNNLCVAYAVLTNEEKRALYDKEDKIELPTQFHSEAMTNNMLLFYSFSANQAFDYKKENVFEAMREQLQKGLVEIHNVELANKEAIKKLKNIMNRLAKESVFKVSIDAQIRTAKSNLQSLSDNKKMCLAQVELLEKETYNCNKKLKLVKKD